MKRGKVFNPAPLRANSPQWNYGYNHSNIGKSLGKHGFLVQLILSLAVFGNMHNFVMPSKVSLPPGYVNKPLLAPWMLAAEWSTEWNPYDALPSKSLRAAPMAASWLRVLQRPIDPGNATTSPLSCSRMKTVVVCNPTANGTSQTECCPDFPIISCFVSRMLMFWCERREDPLPFDCFLWN